MKLRFFVALFAAAFVTLLGAGVGCNKVDERNDPIPETIAFYGTYSDTSGAVGTMDVSGLEDSGQSTAFVLAGELRIAGQAPVTLSGTHRSDTGQLFLEGSGYSFNGTVTAGQAAGTGSGPGGPSSFVLFVGGSSVSVATYCGAWTCTDGCSENGPLTLATSGSVALLTLSYGGASTVAFGTASETGVSLTVGGVDFTLEGTFSGSSISGTWLDRPDNSGTWSADSAQCSSATR